VSARHRKRKAPPAPAPLRHHFALTAAITAALLFAALVVLNDGDPAFLTGSVLLSSGGLGGGQHRLAASSRIAVTWKAWHCAEWPAHVGRAVVLFGRWLLTDEHLLTLIKLGLVLTFVGAMVGASPVQVAIPVATALLVGVVVGLVLAVARRHDPVKPGALLGDHTKTTVQEGRTA
jgi:hypothetical protein